VHEIVGRTGDEGLDKARDGDLRGLREHINAGWDPLTVVDRNGANAMTWASGEGHLAVCQYLQTACGLDIGLFTGKPKRKV
jgi:hypothetical protein